MTPPDHYRRLAAEMAVKARAEQNPHVRAEWMYLARGYRRLAEQADRNRFADVVYEPWPPRIDPKDDDNETGTTA